VVLYRFNGEGLGLALRKPKETNQVQRFKTFALRRILLLDIVSLSGERYGPKGYSDGEADEHDSGDEA
jgi:hypothetical protein